MIIFIISVATLTVITTAGPLHNVPPHGETLFEFVSLSYANDAKDENRNVVTVPPNCPPGQEWINGACREVWRSKSEGSVPMNVVTVPPNCLPGQQWINGACRDVWPFESEESAMRNVVTVPPNCPPGQQWINGACREVWPFDSEESAMRNVVTVPPNCPTGQQWINGACRDVWTFGFDGSIGSRNVVTVPPNCPPGQILVNGSCRPVWFMNLQQSNLKEVLVNSLKQSVDSNVQQKNIITVPNQCPAGYKADANGICRPIF